MSSRRCIGMRMSRWWSVAVIVVAAAACTTSNPAPTSTTTTAPIPVTSTTHPSTTTSPPTSTTTPPGPRVDWDLIRSSSWLTNGPDGVLTDTGQLVWATNPAVGESSIARDGSGGFVWTDLDGLWWLGADATEPTLVSADPPGFLLGVTPTDAGPEAIFEEGSLRFVDLGTGAEVPGPNSPRVRLEGSDPPVVVRAAANGLAARVVGPAVTLDAEGQPVGVTEPARLIVSGPSGPVVDIPVGSFYSPWVTLHDFDGRRVILSRGPLEPALPEETFFLVDLACGSCLQRFTASATRAALVGSDADWDGSNPDTQPGILTAAWLGSDADAEALADGTYLGFLQPDRMGSDRLVFDLAVWFSGPDANVAAREDGETDVPVPDDFYIRNADPTLFTVTVSGEVAVTSVWFDYDTNPDLANQPIEYTDLLGVRELSDSDPRSVLWSDPWWITIAGGEVVRLDEQYVP